MAKRNNQKRKSSGSNQEQELKKKKMEGMRIKKEVEEVLEQAKEVPIVNPPLQAPLTGQAFLAMQNQQSAYSPLGMYSNGPRDPAYHHQRYACYYYEYQQLHNWWSGMQAALKSYDQFLMEKMTTHCSLSWSASLQHQQPAQPQPQPQPQMLHQLHQQQQPQNHIQQFNVPQNAHPTWLGF